MKYAKIVDGHLEYAPRNQPGVSNWINDEAAVLAAGYLPVSEEAVSEGYFVSGWKVKAGEIVPILEKIPEPTIDEQNEAIRQQREQRYIAETDDMRDDFVEAVARGSADASALGAEWVAAKDAIREELPYITKPVSEAEDEIED